MKSKFDYYSFDEYWSECEDVYARGFAENAWDYQQSKVDELTLQVAEMKSRLNDAYTDGQSAMYTARQSEVDELQKRLDVALKIIESYTDRKPSEKYDIDTEIDAIYDVEQALKGD